jgi:hypothetical protein
MPPSAIASVSITSGLDRWRDDECAATANGTAAVDAAAPVDIDTPSVDAPDSPIGPNDAPSNPAADPDIPRRALPYEPFAKQATFHASPAKYRLFGGAAGPGKSKALLMEAIVQADEHPGANTLLLRRTFPELEQSLLLYFRRDVPRELYSNFNESKHVVTWPNGSTTRFGYCAAENDVYQYQGAEFLFIGIDELTLFTLRQWQFLTSRNRCPVPGAFPNMAGATNPGNIGHAWVKSLWIDKQPAGGMENPECYDPDDYDFIPARVHDNPIYATDENYLKTLAALPSHLRRAFLDGDWEVFAGQYFDRFDVTRHVTRAEQIEWKPWWPRWISIDWGFEHPSATYWHASVPVAQALLPASPAGGPVPQVTNAADHATQAVNAASFFSSASLSESESASQSASNSNPKPTPPTPSRIATPSSNQLAAQAGVPVLPNTAPQQTVVTYREYVTHHTAPRDLAHEIIARSLASSDRDSGDGLRTAGLRPAFLNCAVGLENQKTQANAPAGGQRYERYPSESAPREKIDAIYLSPDAFARRTDEASIADQMGDVFAAAGFPRPVPADNDRIGGWMLMYQMLDANEWLLTDNCIELIRTIPTLVRDIARIEDVEKMEGDDPADAARYGLKSRYATRAAYSTERLPYEARLASRVLSPDPTMRAIQARKAQIEEQRRSPHYIPRRGR